MALIKDIYSQGFYNKFAASVEKVLPDFNKKQFVKQALGNGFSEMEWKDRMKHTTRTLHEFLPKGFPKAVKSIEKIITQLRKDGVGEDSLAYMFFPDYIETYGLDDFEHAAKAFEWLTQFVSCEFAVRPFILKYGQRMINQMTEWSLHENHKVRRFASEGSRPRLPWAMAIPELKKHPAAILPLLNNLKNDPHEWVRRSVANNLNDISKDHPDIVMEIARQWKGISKETDAIIKHGSRSLLKKGHAEMLRHYGLESKHIVLADFKIITPKVKIGGSVEFSFAVTNGFTAQQTVRLEYGLYYNKANGQLARKVFKISERPYAPGEKCVISRKQSFKLITTRTFYAGPHELSVIINGEEKAKKTFTLLN